MAEGSGTVTVELFGLPRERAGRGEVVVRAATVGEAVASVVAEFPRLEGLLLPGGGVAPQFLVSVNGQRFVSDPAERLSAGDRLLILSADAGG